LDSDWISGTAVFVLDAKAAKGAKSAKENLGWACGPGWNMVG